MRVIIYGCASTQSDLSVNVGISDWKPLIDVKLKTYPPVPKFHASMQWSWPKMQMGIEKYCQTGTAINTLVIL